MIENTICLDENYSTTRLILNDECLMVNEEKENNSKFKIQNSPLVQGGLRTQGYFKKSYEDKPLISIVTVVYNGEAFLEETILSVINQSYDNVEYIIIDGGSTDGTLDIIKKYENQIDYWVSERDSGIYDAMNKGIDTVSGEWINFMNAGDSFFANDTLTNISKESFKNIDMIYGNTDIGHKILKYKSNIALKDMAQGMMMCHQSTFYRINKNIKYNLNYHICGDQDFTIQYILKNSKLLYLDRTIARYDLNGLSSHNLHKSIKEKFSINRSYNLSYLPIFKSYIFSILVRIRKMIRGY